MVVVNALRKTPSALRRNPVLFVPILVLMLFQAPQLALQSVNPLLSSLVSLVLSLVFIFIMPFFQGGLIGMADESLAGETSLQTFIDDGKANYLSLLVVYFALTAVSFVLAMIGSFVGLVGGALFLGGGVEPGPAVLAVILAVVAVIVLLYLLVAFFVQFYGQAIVLDDLGAVDGVKRSLSVVRHNLVSTVGYSLIGVVIGGLAGLFFGGSSLVLSPSSTELFQLPEPSLALVAAAILLIVGVGTAVGGFFAVFSVAFYRTITG